jgi:hypothetical protein
MTQAGLVYVYTALVKRGIQVKLYDLSGTISYFDAPGELYTSCDSPSWMSPVSIIDGSWMDEYLPEVEEPTEMVFFSALFSPDLVFHARLSHKLRTRGKTATAIGGNALAGLNEQQLTFVSGFFDYVLIGHDVSALIDQTLALVMDGQTSDICPSGHTLMALSAPRVRPDYSLIRLDDFITVYSGHGCYYGKCNFCDYPARAQGAISFRAVDDVVIDLHSIQTLNPSIEDIVLTQDCYTRAYLIDTASKIRNTCGTVPYNLMLRAEPWIDSQIARILQRSGCTDVFIGAEALNDCMLTQLNKGVTTDHIESAVKTLSEYVDVTIGMILFIPNVSQFGLDYQIKILERLVPYLSSIEPEVLTVLGGSYYARFPEKYGIVLDATESVLNDSWCFGLSQDIPWALEDYALLERWLRHIEVLRDICSSLVKQEYWSAIDDIKARLRAY